MYLDRYYQKYHVLFVGVFWVIFLVLEGGGGVGWGGGVLFILFFCCLFWGVCVCVFY